MDLNTINAFKNNIMIQINKQSAYHTAFLRGLSLFLYPVFVHKIDLDKIKRSYRSIQVFRHIQV